jgi:hypothetical protein
MDCQSNRFPGNTVPLLLSGKQNRCICGNEYVPLLVIDAAMQTLVTYSNVPTQRNRGWIVVLSLQPFVNQLLASLRRGKTESVIRWPTKRKSYSLASKERRYISSPPALGQRVTVFFFFHVGQWFPNVLTWPPPLPPDFHQTVMPQCLSQLPGCNWSGHDNLVLPQYERFCWCVSIRTNQVASVHVWRPDKWHPQQIYVQNMVVQPHAWCEKWGGAPSCWNYMLSWTLRGTSSNTRGAVLQDKSAFWIPPRQFPIVMVQLD